MRLIGAHGAGLWAGAGGWCDRRLRQVREYFNRQKYTLLSRRENLSLEGRQALCAARAHDEHRLPALTSDSVCYQREASRALLRVLSRALNSALQPYE